MPPGRILAAADTLFAEADDPRTVTMDAIAAAAGVGKGTLFRAFGSRRELLDALWSDRLGGVREAVEAERGPLGASAPPRERAVAFLDAMLTFKMDNRHLIRAREHSIAGVRQSENYRWTHGLVERLITDADPGATARDAAYTAHALLAALDIDLIEELLASGRTREQIRRAQGEFVRAVINGAAHEAR
ncbi:TetR/AcrR family transcriptional regulator [Streptantibioticus parmotrematis]|uniref:TetR/AcrR family transcriptional regulator n=1 Tax=Streptantibioticus parmotrematis TaxID=2873249 RepID=UPI0027E1DF3E|nr:helix-turn-helix domain-containing protein [Streptantibioticus parmotrematis]